jgi:hypothetical protein
LVRIDAEPRVVDEVLVVISEGLEDAGATAGVGIGPAVESIERVCLPAAVRTLLPVISSYLDD